MSGIPTSTIRQALSYAVFAGVGAWIGRGGLHHSIWPLAFFMVVSYMPGYLFLYSVGYKRGQLDLRRHLKATFDRIPSYRQDRRS